VTTLARRPRCVGSLLLRSLGVLRSLLLLAPVLLVGGLWLAVTLSPTTTDQALAGRRDAVVAAALQAEAGHPGGSGPAKENVVAQAVDELPGVRVLGTSGPDASLVEVDVSIWAGPGSSGCPAGTRLDPYSARGPAPTELPEIELDPVNRPLPPPAAPPCGSGSGTCVGG
jgi:hypothetical protein